MQNFEQIRGHVQSHFRITTNDPYVLCVELSLDAGKRHQSVFLAELEDDDGRRLLRASTIIAPITGIDARRAAGGAGAQREHRPAAALAPGAALGWAHRDAGRQPRLRRTVGAAARGRGGRGERARASSAPHVGRNARCPALGAAGRDAEETLTPL